MSKILIDGLHYYKDFQLKKKNNFILRIYKELNNFSKKIYWKFYCEIKYVYYKIFSKNHISKKKISILCITRERISGFERLIKNIIKKTKDITRIEFLFLIDHDDKFKKKYKEILKKYKKYLLIKIYINKGIKFNSERINFFSKKIKW